MKAKANTKSPELFGNSLLDALTRTHPWVIFAMYVPVNAMLFYFHHVYLGNSIMVSAGYFVLAFFTWTFVEYLIHRHAFHFNHDSPAGRKIHYWMHGIHHQYPNDKERLAMPPLPSLFIAAFFFLLFYFLMGEKTYAFFPGFVTGYLAYMMTHYFIHAFKPPNNPLRLLWRHHHLHHHKYPDKAFGVSSPLWDFVFGTLPPGKSQ